MFLVFSITSLVSYLFYSYAKSPAGTNRQAVFFEVKPQNSFLSIAKDLEEMGVIKNHLAFAIFAKIVGKRGKLKMGYYELRQTMNPGEVLDVIISGRSVENPLTIPEGFNIFEIAEIVEKAGMGTRQEFLGLCKDKKFIEQILGEDKNSLEGYLFPETYKITKYTTAKDLIANMVKRFKMVFESVWPENKTKLNKNEVIVLASIIEKETASESERELISSVFHNRLAQGMKLQTDPTIIYGMADISGEIPSNIRKEDILTPTAFNTYVIKGLPPGPIANPGRASLRAAMNPANTKFLYFVSRNDGSHEFNETYEKHNMAVQKYQLRR